MHQQAGNETRGALAEWEGDGRTEPSAEVGDAQSGAAAVVARGRDRVLGGGMRTPHHVGAAAGGRSATGRWGRATTCCRGTWRGARRAASGVWWSRGRRANRCVCGASADAQAVRRPGGTRDHHSKTFCPDTTIAKSGCELTSLAMTLTRSGVPIAPRSRVREHRRSAQRPDRPRAEAGHVGACRSMSEHVGAGSPVIATVTNVSHSSQPTAQCLTRSVEWPHRHGTPAGVCAGTRSGQGHPGLPREARDCQLGPAHHCRAWRVRPQSARTHAQATPPPSEDSLHWRSDVTDSCEAQ